MLLWETYVVIHNRNIKENVFTHNTRDRDLKQAIRQELPTAIYLRICYVILPHMHFSSVRRKIKVALFPLTCRRRGRVGRSENLFIFRVFFSFLKMGKKVETC